MRVCRLSTVVQGTVITCDSFVTGLYGITRRIPDYPHLATTSAFNSAITASAFFGLREYAVSPALAVTIRRTPEQLSGTSLSWSDIRSYHLLDSGISGAATGGMLRGLMGGRRVILSAAITAGVACVGLQRAYNELAVLRIKRIGKELEPSQPVQHSPPFYQRLLYLVGLVPISDEEYLAKMRRKRDSILARIKVLEEEAEEESKQDKNS
ncbi:hypothetical protein C8J56DRAFT_956202 [Mycena floridula]|nr:hypothetical protein C8J56DRAFT_956202 [Mycena floridula]